MHIEERITYVVPFIEDVLNKYSTETSDFFKRFNISVGSMLAIAFWEGNRDFKNSGNIENTPNLFVGLNMFLQNFNSYEDIHQYFSNQTDELKATFEKSTLYINKDIPDEVKWTLETEERNINVALTQVKKAFATYVVSLTSLHEKIINKQDVVIYDEGKIGQFATEEERQNLKEFASKMYNYSKPNKKG